METWLSNDMLFVSHCLSSFKGIQFSTGRNMTDKFITRCPFRPGNETQQAFVCNSVPTMNLLAEVGQFPFSWLVTPY